MDKTKIRKTKKLCSHCGNELAEAKILQCVKCKALSHEHCWNRENVCSVPGCQGRVWEKVKALEELKGFSLKRYEGGVHPAETLVYPFFGGLFIFVLLAIDNPIYGFLPALMSVFYLYCVFSRVFRREQQFECDVEDGSIESYYEVFGVEFFRQQWAEIGEIAEVRVSRQKVMGVWREQVFLVTHNERELLVQETYDLEQLLLLPNAKRVAATLGTVVVVTEDDGCTSEKSDTYTCPICGEDVCSRDAVWCTDCDTPYHRECWSYSVGCAVFACKSIAAGSKKAMGETKTRTALVPVFSPSQMSTMIISSLVTMSLLSLIYRWYPLFLYVLFVVFISPQGAFKKKLELDIETKEITSHTYLFGVLINTGVYASLKELKNISLNQEIDRYGQASYSLVLKMKDGESRQLSTLSGGREFAKVLANNADLAIEYTSTDETVTEERKLLEVKPLH